MDRRLHVLWTAEGWLYVAVVIDLFSRRAVGWSMSAEMTAQLVTDALVMAICSATAYRSFARTFPKGCLAAICRWI
jgi:transposase InsO family protein